MREEETTHSPTLRSGLGRACVYEWLEQWRGRYVSREEFMCVNDWKGKEDLDMYWIPGSLRLEAGR